MNKFLCVCATYLTEFRYTLYSVLPRIVTFNFHRILALPLPLYKIVPKNDFLIISIVL